MGGDMALTVLDMYMYNALLVTLGTETVSAAAARQLLRVAAAG